jgi:hypothetical protein
MKRINKFIITNDQELILYGCKYDSDCIIFDNYLLSGTHKARYISTTKYGIKLEITFNLK